MNERKAHTKSREGGKGGGFIRGGEEGRDITGDQMLC